MRVRLVVRSGEDAPARQDESDDQQRAFGDLAAGRAPQLAKIEGEQREQGEPRDGVRQPPLLPGEPERLRASAPGHQTGARQRRQTRSQEGGQEQVGDHLAYGLHPAGAVGETAEPDRYQRRPAEVHQVRQQREADAGAAQAVGNEVPRARRQHEDPPGSRAGAQERRGQDRIGGEEDPRSQGGEAEPDVDAGAQVAGGRHQRRGGDRACRRWFFELTTHEPAPPRGPGIPHSLRKRNRANARFSRRAAAFRRRCGVRPLAVAC